MLQMLYRLQYNEGDTTLLGRGEISTRLNGSNRRHSYCYLAAGRMVETIQLETKYHSSPIAHGRESCEQAHLAPPLPLPHLPAFQSL